jgi:glycosyltransferase involved in cell wall biosynthesis
MKTNVNYKIGFISTRFAGTDGVSLETKKWAEVLEDMGHTCFYFAGLCDRPEETSFIVDDAFYKTENIRDHHQDFFSKKVRTEEESTWIFEKKEYLKSQIKEFDKKFGIDIFIVENVMAIPLNIPLGWAITEYIIETGRQTIAHHHDFSWERKRFLVNCVEDYISMAFPPNIDFIQHVVINSHAQYQLARRRGISSIIIPNVMNYSEPPHGKDEYNADLRENLWIKPDELFILQPTRIVERKGIEHAIELVQRMGRKAHLVVSHASGDEGDDYSERIRSYADLLEVDMIKAEGKFDTERRVTAEGEKIYSIWDGYIQCDLVTYPSEFEGFGNAFLEAIYYKKPIVVNNYSIYSTDIKPKGFKVVEFNDYVTDETIRDVNNLLKNEGLIKEYTEINFELANKYFSFEVLRTRLNILLSNAFGTELN